MLFLSALTLTLTPSRIQTDLAKPTPQQVAWQDAEMGMFLHFAPNTWQDLEGDDLSTPLNKINPSYEIAQQIPA